MSPSRKPLCPYVVCFTSKSIRPARHYLCGLLEVPGSLLQARVALFVGAAGTEADSDKGRPCAALEQENGEDDAETEAEGGLDEEVGQAAIPLEETISFSNNGVSRAAADVLRVVRWIRRKYLFVEERLTDGSGNGAWGRSGRSFSHGGQSAEDASVF
jgi:hypothetical protein